MKSNNKGLNFNQNEIKGRKTGFFTDFFGAKTSFVPYFFPFSLL